MVVDEGFRELARQFLQAVSGRLDSYTNEDGIIKVKGDSVSLFTPNHIQYAMYGRAPGKKPPLDPILKWVKMKGIVFDKTDAKGTAFAIQASIGKNGTKNYKPNAPNALQEALNEEIKAYSKTLGDMITIQIDGQVQEILKESSPEVQEFKI